jgi:hypothetical protein
MIFSFSNTFEKEMNLEINQTDIFCFFHTENATSLPQEYWLKAIASSLKMKKNVLILESHFSILPAIDFTHRWQAGDEFLWLAPRSLSVLLEAHKAIPVTYEALKKLLLSTK